MSKDDFPPSITSETILNKTYEFMEDWKNKLYDMLSFNTINLMQVKYGNKKTLHHLNKLLMLIKTIQQNTPPVSIKQEPCDQVSLIT